MAGWITPRLGGVGPMTRAMLLRNAVRAAERGSVGSAGRSGRTTMTEGEFSERPWGNYTVLSDDAPTTR